MFWISTRHRVKFIILFNKIVNYFIHYDAGVVVVAEIRADALGVVGAFKTSVVEVGVATVGAGATNAVIDVVAPAMAVVGDSGIAGVVAIGDAAIVAVGGAGNVGVGVGTGDVVSPVAFAAIPAAADRCRCRSFTSVQTRQSFHLEFVRDL